MPIFDRLLRFTPLYQTRVWGGRRLETVLHRTLPDAQPYGESWELVDREPEQSVVADGPLAGMSLHALWTDHREAVFGSRFLASTSPRFPLLIKILDCADDLSIQVHPPADLAAALHGEPKTEMWYVAHADPGARIYAGLRRGVRRPDFERALGDGTVADLVHHVDARTGDSLFVPSGRLHALGRGLLIYEIQQNSDTTYRVFDWNRLGLDGRPRALHIHESMQSIDFTDVEPTLGRGLTDLAACEFFRVTRMRSAGHPERGDSSSVAPELAPGGAGFRLVLPVARTEWGDTILAPGQLALCPAALTLPQLTGEWLEIEC